MPSLQEQLEALEESWLQPLYENCRRLFAGTFLPSHDQEHHLRVWGYARSVLEALFTRGCVIDERLPASLMLAAFFHDTGLTLNRGETHGLDSRRLCEAWLKNHVYPANDDVILYAIEHHDDKTLDSEMLAFLAQGRPDLLPLLSVSDDMDAFGHVGIYRYAEIYLLRGIKTEDLPIRILPNLENRFRNMERALSGLETLMEHHAARYRTTRSFYLRLAESNAMPQERSSAEPAIVEYIERALGRQMNLMRADRLLNPSEHEPAILEFFQRLDQELAYLT